MTETSKQSRETSTAQSGVRPRKSFRQRIRERLSLFLFRCSKSQASVTHKERLSSTEAMLDPASTPTGSPSDHSGTISSRRQLQASKPPNLRQRGRSNGPRVEVTPAIVAAWTAMAIPEPPKRGVIARSSLPNTAEQRQCRASCATQHRSRPPICFEMSWKSAKDPATGRTYYYHTQTRAVQWQKPAELASEAERKAMQEKERRQREFFAAMEANILKNLEQGAVSPAMLTSKKSASDAAQQNEKRAAARPAAERPSLGVRTISTMDEALLKSIVQKIPSARDLSPTEAHQHPALLSRESTGHTLQSISETATDGATEDSLLDDDVDPDQQAFVRQGTSLAGKDVDMLQEQEMEKLEYFTSEMMDYSDDEDIVLQRATTTVTPDALKREGSDRELPADPPAITSTPNTTTLKGRPPMGERRNTCGTIYVGSTMSAPDCDATIQCVCGVFRAHILQAARERNLPSDDFCHFNDLASLQQPGHATTASQMPAPSLDDITYFYRSVFQKAQMEADCIIVSLIFVERLIKLTGGDLRPRACNWMSLLFSCMVLASKVNDDMSMWNADFGLCCPSGVHFSLQRVNDLELATLSTIDYKVKVKASEYAKYYFLLRSMTIKSGLAGNETSPLDVQGAKRLQEMSGSYQSAAVAKSIRPGNLRGYRSMSAPSAQFLKDAAKATAEIPGKVSLERIVKM